MSTIIYFSVAIIIYIVAIFICSCLPRKYEISINFTERRPECSPDDSCMLDILVLFIIGICTLGWPISLGLIGLGLGIYSFVKFGNACGNNIRNYIQQVLKDGMAE